MISLIPYIVLVLIFYTFLKKNHQRHLELKYKFKMHKLRDDLRMLGATGVVDPNSMIFDYYDDSFSKSIQQSYYLTVPGLAFIYYRHKGDTQLVARISSLREELKNYPELLKIKEKADRATFDYVLHQEVIVQIALWVGQMVFGIRSLKKRAKALVELAQWMPETSAMQPVTC